MRIDSNKIYFMPLIIGPVFENGKVPSLVYREIQVVAMQYETDFAAVSALLPECYRAVEKPIVTAMFGYYKAFTFCWWRIPYSCCVS